MLDVQLRKSLADLQRFGSWTSSTEIIPDRQRWAKISVLDVQLPWRFRASPAGRPTLSEAGRPALKFYTTARLSAPNFGAGQSSSQRVQRSDSRQMCWDLDVLNRNFPRPPAVGQNFGTGRLRLPKGPPPYLLGAGRPALKCSLTASIGIQNPKGFAPQCFLSCTSLHRSIFPDRKRWANQFGAGRPAPKGPSPQPLSVLDVQHRNFPRPPATGQVSVLYVQLQRVAPLPQPFGSWTSSTEIFPRPPAVGQNFGAGRPVQLPKGSAPPPQLFGSCCSHILCFEKPKQ